ncbi:hypothetical protein GCM10010236_29980 [Streptomyces eurythermus]|nr:hypothetical protein GCM10010236_29980 [Streptomyces eurythermus]
MATGRSHPPREDRPVASGMARPRIPYHALAHVRGRATAAAGFPGIAPVNQVNRRAFRGCCHLGRRAVTATMMSGGGFAPWPFSATPLSFAPGGRTGRNAGRCWQR